MAEREYGASITAVYVGVVLMGADHAKRFATKRPVDESGKYQLKGFAFEDTLEFDVVPNFDDVRRASTIQELALILRDALSARSSLLQRTNIPDFDMCRFLADFDEALSSIANSESANVASLTDFRNDADRCGTPGGSFPNSQVSIQKFACEVLDFVEREMPERSVRLAGKAHGFTDADTREGARTD
jgi:hypothetical protein